LPIKIEQTSSIETEVKEMLETDEYLKTILDNVLLKIQETLELGDETYYINVSLEQDIAIPDWKDILVLVKVKKRNHNAKMRLWETIEERVREIIEQIRDKYPAAEEGEIIDRFNENLAIIIQEVF